MIIRPRLRRLPAAVLRQLLESEASGGLILMGVAALAILIANSPAAPIYFDSLKTYVGPLSVLHWVNDALMAVFFLLVGLEIKREFLEGELSTWSRRVLPGVAAAGGMIAPALIYVALNAATPETVRGWAIPTATDIAFALGVLALLGPRVPISLKIFLTALAIIDDLGAVAIIAVFYTADISLLWLALAGATLALLAGLNLAGVKRLPIYLLLGAALWVLTLKSGVHATIAGVALALAIPLRPSDRTSDDASSPLLVLEHALNPWVAFFIVPVFGFANAGVPLSGLSPKILLDPVPLGIAAGLFLGKQIGVFLSIWATVKLRLGERPRDASLAQIYGVSILCGIGFTMSLFIGLLSFPDSPLLQDEVKVGVLSGSVLSAMVGALVLRLAPGHREA